jgi:glycosyltransferase involved in cell wall biosynthesis
MAKNRPQKQRPVEMRDIFVSTVIVAKKSTERLTRYIEDLSVLLSRHYTNYEIIIVDNGVDEGEIETLTETLLRMPCIRVIRLAQNFNHDTALFAGLEVSIGDVVCTLDPSLDPIDVIPEFVEKNQVKDVVQGVSELPIAASKFGQLGRRMFYWYSRKYIGIDIPVNATYLASYSRRAVNALTQTNRSQHHIRHMAKKVGYGYEILPYQPLKHPANNKKLNQGIVEALEISISYSTHPLRFVTRLGLLASIINAIYVIYVITVNVLHQKVAEGWTTTSLQSSLMFFILFIIIVIISEYIGRILIESYKDPQYYIADELTSTVALADVDKRNVTI